MCFSSLLILYDGFGKETYSTAERLRHHSKKDSPIEVNPDEFDDLTLHDNKKSGMFNDWKVVLTLKNINIYQFFPELVTVKIIDFAHSTYNGFMHDPVIHKGPDTGFLTGIDSILHILSASLS